MRSYDNVYMEEHKDMRNTGNKRGPKPFYAEPTRTIMVTVPERLYVLLEKEQTVRIVRDGPALWKYPARVIASDACRQYGVEPVLSES